jgi:predicted methyltransferase
MNKAFYDALKPGGELVVGDYSAKPGAGTSVVKTLHRSDEALARSEIEAAGFKLIGHGDFLHVPGDTRDAHSHSSAQPVDIQHADYMALANDRVAAMSNLNPIQLPDLG